MKSSLLKHYMERVEALASLSHAQRFKVGAIVITPNGVTIDGVNGRFPGHSNVCEETIPGFSRQEVTFDKDDNPVYAKPFTITRTVPEVYHAEQNALAKMLNEGISAKGATLLTSLSPCIECSKWIARAGIVKVYYSVDYRDMSGVEFLKRCGVEVIKYANQS